MVWPPLTPVLVTGIFISRQNSGLAMLFRAVVIASIIFSTAAIAREVMVNSTAIEVEAAGLCELEDSNAIDNTMLTRMRELDDRNIILAMYAECRQLHAWRKDTDLGLPDTLSYKASKSYRGKPKGQLAEAIIKQLCDKMRADGDRATNGAVQDIKAKVEQYIKNYDTTGVKYLGVMDEAPGICYTAILQKMKAENSEIIATISMMSVLFIRDQMIFAYRASPYVDSSSLVTTLANIKASNAALVAANR